MSWSLTAIGKLGPLNAEVDRQFALIKAAGNDPALCQAAHAVISAALAAQGDPAAALKVNASCNQIAGTGPGGKPANSSMLYITVEPIAGFVG